VDNFMQWQDTSKVFIVYCTIAGLISAAGISGLLVIVDIASKSPEGTFFAVIGISLGITDPTTAQYVGLGLHILTGTAAGNIFGQLVLFWRKLVPSDAKRGILLGMVVGIALWFVLFFPLATFGIQKMLDEFVVSAPNTYVNNIALRFQGLYPLVVGGSLLFHLVYGCILGIIAGRMAELRLFEKPFVRDQITK
jgi:hypothetical protein